MQKVFHFPKSISQNPLPCPPKNRAFLKETETIFPVFPLISLCTSGMTQPNFCQKHDTKEIFSFRKRRFAFPDFPRISKASSAAFLLLSFSYNAYFKKCNIFSFLFTHLLLNLYGKYNKYDILYKVYINFYINYS